ncbi:MAG: dTMP kinase [Candidatus Nanohaloarchaeota archaeon QJJ-7]|nr:dTMP kinase [Candidatus Nanohaloarchaeota archaeon QJJ-7]
MDREGNLIVIEGLDSSGKGTQAKILVERLEERGEEARYIEFPTYDRTKIGDLIEEYLDGDYEVPHEVRALLFAADRYQMKESFEEDMENGGVIVADRYSQSNYTFQSGDGGWEENVEWMQEVESRLPQPDIVLLLDIPPEKARQLMEKREEKDVLEQDLEFQRTVAERYRKLAGENDWEVIQAVEDGDMRTRDDIAEEIWEKVEKVL